MALITCALLHSRWKPGSLAREPNTRHGRLTGIRSREFVHKREHDFGLTPRLLTLVPDTTPLDGEIHSPSPIGEYVYLRHEAQKAIPQPKPVSRHLQHQL